MQHLRWLILFAAVASVAADGPEKDDLAKLQGEWVPESIQIGPKKTPAESLGSFRLTVEGDAWTMTTQGSKKYKVKIDPAKTPKHLDLIDEIGGKERVTPCLYEFRGDKLVVCRPYMQMKPNRPEKIEPDDTFIGVTVWKREGK
ncbi:TIGR03067 domain-containing protein [Tundrisphaera sp. TA3]|uniref:TIGR03067 domain-containing protein n=1 Tax=Tundrisphaera sp. TA3 TaxID=3435775 RepID=UPI003EB8516C